MKQESSRQLRLGACSRENEGNFVSFSHKDSKGYLADCFDFMNSLPENSIQAIVTDPPYGVKEYEHNELVKKETGVGGVWRIPPSFDGNVRSPLPRFTALNNKERAEISEFFKNFSQCSLRILAPGAHVFIASNAFVSQLVFEALVAGGLEFRGEIIRLVRTLRGGDRPKNAESEFPNVCSMPRGCFEPWGLFRKPLPPKMKVSDCLKEFGTGGLRRLPDGNPFIDVIHSERTSKNEREIANHPSIKPQSLMRLLTYASLPLGTGTIFDPFMGSGSTLAAAASNNLRCIGTERVPQFFELSKKCVPKLAGLEINFMDHLKESHGEALENQKESTSSSRKTRHGKSNSAESSQSLFDLRSP